MTFLLRFNLKQRDICRYRLKLLQYQDRLSTYELILGGIHIAHEEYDSNFFTRFRDVNLVQAAVEYARVKSTLYKQNSRTFVSHMGIGGKGGEQEVVWSGK